MKTLLLVAALSAPTVLLAQVRIQTAPGAFAYVTGDPDRPMIGVSTRSTGKRDTLGLMVESVTRDGPAEQAGIEEGDRLVSVNTINLRLSPADAGETDMDGVANRRLVRELEKQKAGDEVELRLYRDGTTRTVRVKTVTADELNNTNEFATASRGFSRRFSDRAILGLSLGGNGSRRDTLGILVVGINDDGPASKAGIEEGDRVSGINGVDLRVAKEDAGDGQASTARINRLNREMENVKAGDTVEVRVYGAGQVRTVRVESVKASELDGNGFFFQNGRGIRSITIPRAARVRPPGVAFDDLPMTLRRKADVESKLRGLQGRIRSSVEPTLRMREKMRAEVQSKMSALRSRPTF